MVLWNVLYGIVESKEEDAYEWHCPHDPAPIVDAWEMLVPFPILPPVWG